MARLLVIPILNNPVFWIIASRIRLSEHNQWVQAESPNVLLR